MQVIYKYPLPLDDRAIKLKMPWGARILHVAAQGDALYPYLWALIETDERTVEREFVIVGTGNRCDGIAPEAQGPRPEAPRNYIGTAHCGAYVWHVFEVTP
jgi:hypothetical protein